MSGMHLTVRLCASRGIVQLKQRSTVAALAQSVGMAISVRLATTGELLYTMAYKSIDDLRVWELRQHLCQALKSTAFFSWILFHDQVLVDDAALVSAYPEEPRGKIILFHAVLRELRPPTEEEEMAIRSQLWNIMSRGFI